MVHKLVFRPATASDLRSLYDYIADRAGAHVASAYIDRIESACGKLTTFPERGTVRDELAPGVRVIGFERRASIVFRVEGDVVRILRVLYGGQGLPDEWDPL